MPSPKSGSPGSLVGPADPDAALDADKADPGAVEAIKAEERGSQSGKYGSQDAKPFKKDKPESNSSDSEKSWIKIKLVDEEGQPVAGEAYKIKLPDGTFATGTTDGDGKASASGFDPGSCEVSFPNLDKSVVEEK